MLRKIISMMMLVALFYSCGKSLGEIKYIASGDAFIRAIKTDDKMKYAPVFTAEGSTKTDKGIATNSKGKTYNLVNFWNKENEIRWVPSEADYSASFPTTENYKIKVISTSKKEIIIEQSVALNKVPESFDILKIDANNTSGEIVVGWEQSNADFFTITISKKLDSFPLFQSGRYTKKAGSKENPQVTINSSTLKWFAELTKGETYIMQIHAFNLDNGTTGSTDIAGEFIAMKTFTW